MKSSFKNDRELMPPPDSLPIYRKDYKKKKKTILEEEEYVNALEIIIERDFFPESSKLRDEIDNPSDTPNTIVSELIKNKAVTLDRFVGNYTSEDNNSFEELHQRDLLEKRKKLHWAYEPDDKAQKAGMLNLYYMDGRTLSGAEREKFDSMLSLPESIGDNRQNAPDTWQFRVRNQLLFPPELEVSEEICRVKHVEGREIPAIANWTGNPLLGWDESNNKTSLAHKTTSKNVHNSYVGDPIVGEKQIVYKNTRILDENKNIRNRFHGFNNYPIELPHTPSTFSEYSVSSSGSNYRPVTMTPIITPGVSGDEPIFTWGDIGGTPMILDSARDSNGSGHASSDYSVSSLYSSQNVSDNRGNDLGSRFEIKPTSKRELLAHDLSNSKKIRISTKKSVDLSTPVSSSEKRKSLTPAALALANRLSNTPLRISESNLRGRKNNSGDMISTPSTPFGGSLSLGYSKPTPIR